MRLGMEMVRARSRLRGLGCSKGREGRGSRHLLEGICQEGEGTLSGKGGSATFLGHGWVQGAHQKVPSRVYSERTRNRPRGLEKGVDAGTVRHGVTVIGVLSAKNRSTVALAILYSSQDTSSRRSKLNISCNCHWLLGY